MTAGSRAAGNVLPAAGFLLVAAAHAGSPAFARMAGLHPGFLPLAPVALSAALARSAGFFLLAAVALAGWRTWGAAVLRTVRGRRSDWPFELAAGLIVASLAAGGLGFAGLIRPAVLAAFLAVTAASAALARAWRGPVGWVSGFRLKAAWPALCLLPAVPWLLVAPLLPVTDVDMLEYHAGLPELWSLVHRVHYEPGNVLFTMPLGFERLAIPFFGLGLGGTLSALGLVLLGCAAATVASAAEDDRPGGGMAGWLVFGFAAALLLGWQGHPDGGLVFAAALGVRAAARPGMVPLGVACALAAFTKYQGAGLAAAILVSVLPRRAGGAAARRGLAVAALAVLPNLPWLARNWLLTGNPVYPFLSHLFPSLHWTDWNTQVLWGSMANASIPIEGAFPEDRARELAAAFWTGTRSVWITPYAVLIYLLPLVAVLPGSSPLSRRLAVQGLAFALLWLLPIPKFGRYLVPGIVPALAASWLAAGKGRLAPAAGAALLAVEGLMFVTAVRETPVAPEKVLTGASTPAAFRRGALGGWVPAVDWLNARGQASSRVLVIGQGYGMGLRSPWLASNETGRPAWLAAAGEVPSARRMRVGFRQAGVGWVLYNPIRAYHRHTYALGYRLSESWLDGWAGFWRKWVSFERPPDVFDWTGSWWIWRVRDRAGPPRPQPWLPGAERLILDEAALARGAADPELLVLQERVAGDFGFAWFQRAMLALHRNHDPARAISLCEGALARGFTTPGSLNVLGVSLAGAGRRTEAFLRFREALVLEPGNREAAANLQEAEARAAARTR